MEDQVIATKESLHEWMFEKGICQAIIASVEGKDVGFALYFFNFSTYLLKNKRTAPWTVLLLIQTEKESYM